MNQKFTIILVGILRQEIPSKIATYENDIPRAGWPSMNYYW